MSTDKKESFILVDLNVSPNRNFGGGECAMLRAELVPSGVTYAVIRYGVDGKEIQRVPVSSQDVANLITMSRGGR